MGDNGEKTSVRSSSSRGSGSLLIGGLASLGVAVCLLVLLALNSNQPDSTSGGPVAEEQKPGVDRGGVSESDNLGLAGSRKGYYQSLFQDDPSIVQGGFLMALENKTVDVDAKTDAYFVTHRYVDNGGDIYELYDFFDRYPELAFLNAEAAEIRPAIFDLIQQRRAPAAYSDQGMYAYLAYLEVLERHGYANVAMTSTAANQYAKLAFYKAGIRKEKSEGRLSTYPDYSLDEIASDVKKAQFFLKMAAEPVSWLVSGESSVATGGVQSLDVFYAVEQYGSALRYLEAYGVSVKTKNTASEIFTFGTKFTRQELPALYLYFSLSNAATLLLVDASQNEIRNALYPFFDIKSPEAKRSGIVERVIRARLEAPNARFRDLDLYSKKKITELGRSVPEFKVWLISNGWKEKDFDEQPLK